MKDPNLHPKPPKEPILLSLDIIGLFLNVPDAPTSRQLEDKMKEAGVPHEIISEGTTRIKKYLSPDICQFRNQICAYPDGIGVLIGDAHQQSSLYANLKSKSSCNKTQTY